MRAKWIIGLLALAGCPAPQRFRVERPGLACDRATRVAYRTLETLGYTVTSVSPADQVHPGDLTGTRPKADGGIETVRVVIHCGATGATLQPFEEALFPTYDFSRAFGYSFKTLVQQPDVEEPRAAIGLEVLVEQLSAQKAILDLDGIPTGPTAATVRVTIRNHTDRPVAIDPAHIDLVPAHGDAARALTGAALAAVLVPGPAADRVRRERLTNACVPAHATTVGFLVYPAGTYREARIAIEDVETGETEGFVIPIQ